ncbi:LysR family transcriptional regulator [Orrella sp. JC864]|uniref:LysR family transcriptional regulator n=1 Tax=Orrella sp. JC864 TaxID=3120298 RepID=UPI0012BD57DA
MIPFNHLDWDDLRYLLEVARAGSLAGAAKRLRVDHSTVSRRIAQLEFHTGASLFERRPQGLRATERGLILLQCAEAVEAKLLLARERFESPRDDPCPRVRLASMEGIASLYLARRLERLRQHSPDVTLELVTSTQLVSVARREADLFLSFFQPEGKGWVSRKLGEFKLALYGSPGYFARHGVPGSVRELGRHRYVTYVDDLINLDAVRWLDEVLTQRRVGFHSTSMIAQMNAAASGEGLVLLPVFADEQTPLVPVLWPQVQATREVWLSVHAELQFAPRIKSMSEALAALFAADGQYLAAPHAEPARRSRGLRADAA